MLKWFVSVCDTMQFAHDRFVLHRDLKPSNIMVGKYGEVLIVDWGLAKRLGAVVAGGKRAVDPEATYVPNGPQESGTAPRFDHGRGDDGDAAVYESRTGGRSGRVARPSHRHLCPRGHAVSPACGATFDFARAFGSGPQKVRTGDIVRPREVNPAVPRALEAICRKGMALDPDLRYPSARALAEDVERWLADAPVSVLREGVADRLRRFARRHRTAVLTAMGGLLAVALVATVATVLISASRDVAVRLAEDNGRLAESEAVARKSAETLATRI